MNLMCEGIDDVDEQTVRVLPVMLYINELCEQMAVPPIYFFILFGEKASSS